MKIANVLIPSGVFGLGVAAVGIGLERDMTALLLASAVLMCFGVISLLLEE